MATQFSDLYVYIRALVGDVDIQRQIYRDETLGQHLYLFGLINASDFPLADESSFADLTSSKKAEAILSAVKSLVAGKPDFMSYKNPIISISRSGDRGNLISWIDQQLYKLKAASYIAWSTELDALFLGPSNFLDALDATLAKL